MDDKFTQLNANITQLNQLLIDIQKAGYSINVLREITFKGNYDYINIAVNTINMAHKTKQML